MLCCTSSTISKYLCQARQKKAFIDLSVWAKHILQPSGLELLFIPLSALLHDHRQHRGSVCGHSSTLVASLQAFPTSTPCDGSLQHADWDTPMHDSNSPSEWSWYLAWEVLIAFPQLSERCHSDTAWVVGHFWAGSQSKVKAGHGKHCLQERSSSLEKKLPLQAIKQPIS